MKWNQPLFYDECPVNCIMERAFISPAEQAALETRGERETEWEFSELLLSAGTRSPVRVDEQEAPQSRLQCLSLPQLELPTRHSWGIIGVTLSTADWSLVHKGLSAES